MKKNFFSLIALLAGVGVVIYGIIGGGGAIGMFISVSSLFIVLGGSIAALAIVYSLNDLKKIPKLFGVLITESTNTLKTIPTIFEQLSKKAKKEGVLSLETTIPEIEDDFLRRGLQLVVDGTDADEIRAILETEIEALEERHAVNQGMMAKWSSLAPGFGMIGTVIGLIIMLGDLGGDASELGAGMATALITTFYGSFFQNLIFGPITDNLKKKTAEEVMFRQIMLEGIVMIQNGTNPKSVKDKLAIHLPPRERLELYAEEAPRGE